LRPGSNDLAVISGNVNGVYPSEGYCQEEKVILIIGVINGESLALSSIRIDSRDEKLESIGFCARMLFQESAFLTNDYEFAPSNRPGRICMD
jgi:hypothetical protein